MTDTTSVDELTLAPVNRDGLSHTTFSIPLTSNTHPKLVALSYQFDAASYKKMTVMAPIVVAEGCQEKPETFKHYSSGTAKGSAEIETFEYGLGWPGDDLSLDDRVEIESEYGKEIDLSVKTRHQMIELGIYTAKNCTKLSGSFDVQFK